MQVEWWDNVGILPSHPTVPPLHHIPDITLPTLHRIQGAQLVSGNRGPPPPFITPKPPLRRAPLQDPPSYATANPSVLAHRSAPPMAHNFVDGLSYTNHRDILVADNFGGRGTKFVNILTRCSM